MRIRTESRQMQMLHTNRVLNQSLLQSNHMQTNFFLLLPYPYVPCLTPFTSLAQPAPYAYSPYTYAELTHFQTCTPSSQSEPNLFPEAPEDVKMEDACSKTKEEAPKKQPSRFRYPKKNVQSNVVNQCYSFLTTRSKSLPIVSKLLQTKQQINLFYMMMKQGRKKQTKYMGRQVLDELVLLEEDHPVYLLYRKLGGKNTIKITELRRAILGAITYFLRKIIVCAILTSSKLDRSTVKEHLARSRDILAFLNRKTECL